MPSSDRAVLIDVARRKAKACTGNVVFIHGIGGHPQQTWTDPDTHAFWPAWIAADFPDLGVWSVGYPDRKLNFLDDPTMQLPDRAINLLALLDTHGVLEKPLVFVTHSMGGLLAKQMLWMAETAVEYQRLCENIKGIVFVATPHGGSSLASVVARIASVASSRAVRQLEAHEPHLRQLNLWYRNSQRRFRIQNGVFFETAPTKSVMVVGAYFADPGIEGVTPVPLDGDHFQVCLCTRREDTLYGRTKRLIEDVLAKEADFGFKLIAFDLDGTLLRGVNFDFDYSWRLVWQGLGLDDNDRNSLMRYYLKRTISYEEWCKRCCATFRSAGLTRAKMKSYAECLRPTRNLKTSIDTLKSMGLTTAIISGGINTVLEDAISDHKSLFDEVFINEFEFDLDDGPLKHIRPTQYDFEKKVDGVDHLCSTLGITRHQAIFVGENDNDVDVIRHVGLGIAYPCHSTQLSKAANLSVSDDDLSVVVRKIIAAR